MFGSEEVTNIGTEKNKLRVSFNWEIGRYNGIEDISILLDVQDPGTEQFKLFIWVDEECRNLRIKICVQASKVGSKFAIEGQKQVPSTCH